MPHPFRKVIFSMLAVAYLTGYTVSMYLDTPAVAGVFFGLLFQTFFLKHCIRIASPWLRVPLITILWPFRCIDYLLVCLRYAPRSLLESKPYLLLWAMYIASIEGTFVPEEKRR